MTIFMRKISTFFLVLNLLLVKGIWAQKNSSTLYPNVQKITSTATEYPIQGFKLNNPKWIPIMERTALAPWVKSPKDANMELNIGIKNDFYAEKFMKKIHENEGAYYLKITKKAVYLAAKDTIGIFYGFQTLRQLIQNGNIQAAEITDYPTVPYRGVVEGFYGTPWSQADRLSQLKFYGTMKANTYIYGPKDDPYHSSPHWREAYPSVQAEQIKELVKTANENFVDFVWAMHPGKDIKWNYADQQNVLKKLEAMYQLGVRSFALFFDDISGEGTDAHQQAALLNMINEKFVKVKKNVKPLMMCPTEYNKSWANPKPNGYLSILGKELHPSIQIMWTGDKVVDNIAKPTLEWVQERIKRPALIWWNFPVTDYVRDHLMLGAAYGLENGITNKQMSGILSNPMEHAEASKFAIFGVADYAWNTASYQAQAAWIAGIQDLLPKSHDAFEIFAENNADPGKNGHKFRREESQTLLPYFTRLNKSIPEGNPDKADLDFVSNYFEKMTQVLPTLKKNNDNPALTNEIQAWLEDFDLLAQKANTEIKNYQSSTSENEEVFWNRILDGLGKNTKAKTPKKKDKNIVIPITGTLIIRPFVDSLQIWNNEKFVTEISGQKNTVSGRFTTGEIQTEIKALQNAHLEKDNQQVISLSPILEYFSIQPNQSFIIKLSQSLKNAEIKVNFDTNDMNWALIEISEDGKKWFSPNRFDKEKEIISTVDEHTFKYIRCENIGLDPVQVRMNEFSIENKKVNAQDQAIYLHDFDVYSFLPLKANEKITELCTASEPKQVVILNNDAQAEFTIEIQNTANEWSPLSTKFKGTYIKIDIPSDTKAISLISNKNVQIHEILWK